MQSAEYIKPLFKQLRKRDLDPDVLRNVAEIVHYMQKREYLRSNDAYLRLSIGNAPWPIGVTMVGVRNRITLSRLYKLNLFVIDSRAICSRKDSLKFGRTCAKRRSFEEIHSELEAVVDVRADDQAAGRSESKVRRGCSCTFLDTD